jgi:hypothetical protein
MGNSIQSRSLWKLRRYLNSAPLLQLNTAAVRPLPQRPTLMNDILNTTGHRPWPLPSSHWTMTQRWNDLLFAHWPVPAADIAPLIPQGLAVDTFDGSAWVGVVPFWMDQIHTRGLPAIPGANRFPELNLRTYVREPHSNMSGVYFFSLDAGNPLAVAAARTVYKLPYYWSKMSIEHIGDREFLYSSERRFAKNPARLRVRYRSLGQAADKQGLEQFLTERYALYTADKGGALFKGNIHHLPWPLERAEAEFEINELPTAHGITLPDTAPLLHYSRELVVYVWALEPLPKPHLSAARTPVPSPNPSGV